MNIIRINNGFTKDGRNFIFQNFINEQDQSLSYEIISDSQVHIGTDNGIMFLDLFVTIDGQIFTDINFFVDFLFNYN